MAKKILSKTKSDKYDNILATSSIHTESKKLTAIEKVELKSHAIKKVVKIGKYKV